jgi:DNA-binding transcriptional regulator YiaG
MSTDELVRIANVREACASGAARTIRVDAGLSLGEVARHVDVGVPTVHRWEVGQRRPRGEAALRYGELLEALTNRRGAGP